MTISSIKNSLGTAVRFLNQPLIKGGVKNIASAAAFAFGFIDTYDTYRILHGREISVETNPNASKWVQIAAKVALVCAKVSLILSAATSRPGVLIISTLAGSVFSRGQLERAFGPNTIFAINPWHPRHIFSIGAVILALPAFIQSTYQGMRGICTNTSQPENGLRRNSELAGMKVRMMALFNTITSRPVQHLGNQLCRAAIRV